MTVEAQELVSKARTAEERQAHTRAEFRKSLTSTMKKRKHMIKLRILLLNQLKTVSPCVFVYVRMYVCVVSVRMCVYEIAYPT